MSKLQLQDLSSLKDFFTEPLFIVDQPQYKKTPEALQMTQTDSSEIQNSAPEIKYVGSYQKGILILVDDEQNEVSTEDGKILLKNILKYLKVEKNEFGIINLNRNKSILWDDIKSQLNPEKIIAFGIDWQQLKAEHIGSANYQFQENIHYFLGAALQDMTQNVDLKKQFNSCLKNFN